MSKNAIRTAAVALAGAATIAGLGALGTGTAAAAPTSLPNGCYDIWGPAVPGAVGTAYLVVGRAHVDGAVISAFGQRGHVAGNTVTIAGLRGFVAPGDDWDLHRVTGIPGIYGLSEGCNA